MKINVIKTLKIFTSHEILYSVEWMKKGKGGGWEWCESEIDQKCLQKFWSGILEKKTTSWKTKLYIGEEYLSGIRMEYFNV